MERAKNERKRLLKQATVNKSMILRSQSNAQILKSGEFISMVCKGHNDKTFDHSEQPNIHNPLKTDNSFDNRDKYASPKQKTRTKTLVIMS